MSGNDLKVKGQVFFACVHSVNRSTVSEKNPHGHFTIEIALDKEQSETLQELGLKPARRGAEHDHVPVRHELAGDLDVFRFKRNKVIKDGTDIGTPPVFDSQLNPVPDLIGNGTTGILDINVYPYTFKGKKGHAGGFKGLQILDLIPYARKPMFEKTEGFVVSSAKANDTGFEVQEGDVPF